MTYRDLCHELDCLRCTCDINQRYHQALAWRWRTVDRLAKVSVALVATLAFAAEFWSHEHHGWAIGFAGAAAVLATLLNVIPFGEVEKESTEMFRAWSDLRVDVETMIVKAEGPDEKQAPDPLHDRLAELRTKQKTLDGKEPAPWRDLLERCQEDSNEAFWGKGIRTPAQIEAERARRQKAISEAAAAAAPGK
jgi:hypothetical protein